MADTPPAGRSDVTVIIPAYNAARTIERAIASVADQAAEIVVVDDGSTDGTRAVLDRLAGEIPVLRVLKNETNLGPGPTRNRAVEAATQPWIAVLDADDAMAEGRLARLVEVAKAEDLEALSDLPVNYDATFGRISTKQLPAPGGVERVRLAHLLRPDPATALDLGMMKPIFRTELRDRELLRYPDFRHAQDWSLYVELMKAGVRFGLLREAHYVFTTRVGADSGQLSPFSVTRLDYRSIAERTKRLSAEMQGHPEWTPEAQALAEARIARALKQNRLWGWTMLRQRQRKRFADWLKSDPRNAGVVAWIALRKLGGHRGSPDWD